MHMNLKNVAKENIGLAAIAAKQFARDYPSNVGADQSVRIRGEKVTFKIWRAHDGALTVEMA